MKKIILMITLITVAGNTIDAQSTESTTDLRDRPLFGLKVGANYSNVYDSKGDQFQADPKIGFAGGAFVAIPIGKYFGVQPEVLLSQKGFKATGRLFGNDYQFTRTTTYIDVPLLFAFKPSEFITLLAGPQYSYLINRKDVFVSTPNSFQQETEFKNQDLRKNTLCFLGGVDLTLKRMVISARAGWDLQTNNGDGSSTTPRYKNAWYQATVGYRF